jgi:hypothetical protein
MKILFKILDLPAGRQCCGFRILDLRKKNNFSYSITLLFVLLSSITIRSQIYTENDVEICSSKFQLAVDKNWENLPIGDLISEVGKSFIGTDYLAGGIEVDGDEQLVVNFNGLDCTTLLENSLAISRCIKKGKTSFEDYQHELRFIRYRGGVIDEYPSRLHYFSDWIYDNTSKGVVEDMTEEIGGKKVKFNLNFMSTHPESYKHLQENPEFIPIIEKQEKEISCRQYFYIPKDKLKSKEELINNGDLIAITTTIKGLDIGHVGIAVRSEDGRIYLLHAPTENTKVQISEQPLTDYLLKFKKHSGIIVLRVIEQIR